MTLILPKRFQSAARERAPEAPKQTLVVRNPDGSEIVLPEPKEYKGSLTPTEHRAEAQRMALSYARQRSGDARLPWKVAKRLLRRWEKEEKAADRAAKNAEPTAPF